MLFTLHYISGDVASELQYPEIRGVASEELQ
jgi:hypothetical protein